MHHYCQSVVRSEPMGHYKMRAISSALLLVLLGGVSAVEIQVPHVAHDAQFSEVFDLRTGKFTGKSLTRTSDLDTVKIPANLLKLRVVRTDKASSFSEFSSTSSNVKIALLAGMLQADSSNAHTKSSSEEGHRKSLVIEEYVTTQYEKVPTEWLKNNVDKSAIKEARPFGNWIVVGIYYGYKIRGETADHRSKKKISEKQSSSTGAKVTIPGAFTAETNVKTGSQAANETEVHQTKMRVDEYGINLPFKDVTSVQEYLLKTAEYMKIFDGIGKPVLYVLQDLDQIQKLLLNTPKKEEHVSTVLQPNVIAHFFDEIVEAENQNNEFRRRFYGVRSCFTSDEIIEIGLAERSASRRLESMRSSIINAVSNSDTNEPEFQGFRFLPFLEDLQTQGLISLLIRKFLSDAINFFSEGLLKGVKCFANYKNPLEVVIDDPRTFFMLCGDCWVSTQQMIQASNFSRNCVNTKKSCYWLRCDQGFDVCKNPLRAAHLGAQLKETFANQNIPCSGECPGGLVRSARSRWYSFPTGNFSSFDLPKTLITLKNRE